MCTAIYIAAIAIGIWFLSFWFWPGGEGRARHLSSKTLVWAVLAVVVLLGVAYATC